MSPKAMSLGNKSGGLTTGSPRHLIITQDSEFTHSATQVGVPRTYLTSALKEHGQLPLKPKYTQLSVAMKQGNSTQITQRTQMQRPEQ